VAEADLVERYEATGDEAVFAEATRLYEQTLADEPEAGLLIGYGYLLERHGRYALRRAVAQYERALELETSRRSTPASGRSIRLDALPPIQLDDIGEGCGVLGPLVVLAEPDHAREPERVAEALLGPAGGVHRRAGDVVGQHLDRDPRLDPDARLHQRANAHQAPRDRDPVAAGPDLPPIPVPIFEIVANSSRAWS
jgi:hypothetical protein